MSYIEMAIELILLSSQWYFSIWVQVQEVCDFISLEKCRGLYASMLDRIANVLVNGHIFKRFLHCSAKTDSMYIYFFKSLFYHYNGV